MADEKQPQLVESGSFRINLAKAGEKLKRYGGLKKVESLYKRMTHRQLTLEELAMAQKGVRQGFNSPHSVEYSMVDGLPQLKISECSYGTSQDVSHPEIIHGGYSPDESVYYKYTTDGKLIEMSTYWRPFYANDWDVQRHSIVRFDPPGCLIGKKVKEEKE